MDLEGGCQCGRVRYRAEGPSDLSSICYCRMCQKASGGPFMVFVRFLAHKISWSVQPEIFASSNFVERGFCKACGTPLTYRLIDSPNVSVTLHSLDDPTAVPAPNVSGLTEQKASWLPDFAGMQHDEWDLTTNPNFTSNQSS
ncbi:GFA family protein [Rhodopila sp.]|uniref:GFA family protein n=1 Tax=Rhodopila sp. TaxID=2480087 RepID=UPI003D121D4C